MLSILLILLFAARALAAPITEVNVNSINDVEPMPSNGRLVGAYLFHNAFDNMDGGEKSVFVQFLLHAIADTANLADPISQARALAEGVAVLVKLSNGIPGDACAESNFINSYVSAIRAGNHGGARAAAADYVNSLASGINSIAQLAINPTSARFASGRTGNCVGGGAVYQFEDAWDLARYHAPSEELIQEEYCAAKSLYNGFTASSRNVGAAATAAAQRHVVEAFRAAAQPMVNFLAAIGSGSSNIGQAARVAEKALSQAARNLPY